MTLQACGTHRQVQTLDNPQTQTTIPENKVILHDRDLNRVRPTYTHQVEGKTDPEDLLTYNAVGFCTVPKG